MAEISALKYLKDVRLVVPIISPPNLPVLTLQKLHGLWWVTREYHRLKQEVVPVAVAMLDVASLPGQVNMASCV